MKLYSVKFNETFNNWKDHISIKDAFSRFPVIECFIEFYTIQLQMQKAADSFC